jgi:beta-propeller repeat-containing protein
MKSKLKAVAILMVIAVVLVLAIGSIPSTYSPKQADALSRRLQKRDQGARARLDGRYERLPLSFEANRGQTDPQVKFLSRGRGYALFLTGNEAVVSLRSQKSEARTQENSSADLISEAAALPAFSLLLEAPQGPKSDAFNSPFTIHNSKFPLIESTASSFVRLRLEGANPKAKVVGLEELPGKVNYFIGNDPKKWRTNVPTYAKVRYKNVYPGVDLVYHGNQGRVEYDFVVAPGADPNAIRFAVAASGRELPPFLLPGGIPLLNEEGTKEWSSVGTPPLQIDPNGDLVIQTDAGEVRFHKPVVYQPEQSRQSSVVSSQSRRTKDGGQRTKDVVNSQFTIQNSQLVDGRFVLTADNHIQFEIPSYDKNLPLIIDPVVVYSTYLGGSTGDSGAGIAVDPSGNVYLVGSTSSADFPAMNAIQAAYAGNGDAFVTKLNAAGSALIYSTYLGGSGQEFGKSIAVDSSGNAYVTGSTNSTNFPTANPFQAANGSANGNAFVTKLNAAGSALVYSTYLGGTGGSNDVGFGIAVDSSGDAYVTGVAGTTDFPTMNPIQAANAGPPDAFVTKFNAAGSALVYSTYLGGSAEDGANGIAVDSSGNAYITGTTASTDFPTMNPIQAANAGGGDTFVAKLNAAGSALVYSTYLGGSGGDGGNGIAVDSPGNTYVTGVTYSTNFPTMNPIQAANAGFADAFVTKLNAAGSALVYSTYLGGSGNDYPNGIAVDASGNAYVTGITGSTDFPTMNPIQAANTRSNGIAFVTRLNAAGSALGYSTYLGGSSIEQGNGITVDSSGNAYVTGFTGSNDFPTVNPLQATCGGGCLSPAGGMNNAFVAKVSPANAAAASLAPAAIDFFDQFVNTTSKPQTVALRNMGSAALTISNISITGANTGDFALGSNTCGTGLSGGSMCSLLITFTPTAGGPRSATLTVNDSTTNSPQTVALAGAGRDFALAVASGSPATVTAGGTATYKINVSPLGGFSSTVNLSCMDPASLSTCTPSATSVTLDGTNSQNVTVMVTTMARGMLPRATRPRDWPWKWIVLPLFICLVALMLGGSVSGRKYLRPQIAFALLLFSLAGWVACGGGGGSSPPPQTGTPAGTYTLTVTGTFNTGSNVLKHQATLTLNVN